MRHAVLIGQLGLAAIAVLAPTGSAQLVFTPPEFLDDRLQPVSTTTDVVTAVDVDQDGREDVLLVTATDAQVFLNAAPAPLVPQTTQVLGGHQKLLAVADLDDDADPDLVLQGEVVVFPGLSPAPAVVSLGQPGAGFGSVSPAGAAPQPDVGAAGDLDGDGHLDLVFGRRYLSFNDAPMEARLGDGAGGFGPGPALPSVTSGFFNLFRDVVVADVDHDGHTDIVAANQNGEVRVHRGLGGGSFAAPVLQDTAVVGAEAMRFADLDLDGELDLVSMDQGTLFVELGLGDGTFGPAATTSYPGAADTGLVVADLDGDGLQDLALFPDLSNNSSDRFVTLVRREADGSFRPPVMLDTVDRYRTLTALDVDGDGRRDLVGAWWETTQVTVEGRLTLEVGANATYGAGSPFLDLAGGHPWSFTSSSKRHPILLAGGPLTAGSTMTLDLYQGKAGQVPRAVLGFTELGLPFYGGTLVPFPDRIILMPVYDAAGESHAAATMPAAPQGTQFWFQVWFPDSLGPTGWAGTSGAVATVP